MQAKQSFDDSFHFTTDIFSTDDRYKNCKIFVNTIFSHYPQRKRFDYANFSIPSTPKNYFLPSFRPSHQKKSFYFITDISAQVCPLMLQGYFPFLLITDKFFPFILQRTFFLQKAGIRLKNCFDKR